MAAPTAAYSRALVFNERLLGVLYKNFDAMQLIQLSLLSQFYCKRLVVYEMTSDEWIFVAMVQQMSQEHYTMAGRTQSSRLGTRIQLLFLFRLFRICYIKLGQITLIQVGLNNNLYVGLDSDFSPDRNTSTCNIIGFGKIDLRAINLLSL